MKQVKKFGRCSRINFIFHGKICGDNQNFCSHQKRFEEKQRNIETNEGVL
ncbi:MAG: hypothetical protein HUJ74_02270 [Lachnospiraceae bacterium]|nr:hypothetical protein [Lachnospiraceae bacterium]